MPRRNRGPHLWWRRDREQWFIRWYDGGSRRARATGFGRGEEAAANAALARFILDREAPRRRDPAARLIADVLAGYAEEHAPNTATGPRIGYSIEHLLGWWTVRTVADIDESACRSYYAHRRARGAAPGTIRNELLYLGAALNHDVRRRRLDVAPPVWKPAKPDPRGDYLTRAEVARLLRGARRRKWGRRHIVRFIMVAYYLAGRHESLLELRWPRVDLEAGIVSLNPVGRIQTDKHRAELPIPRRLLTFLRYWKVRDLARGLPETAPVISYGGKRLTKGVGKGFRMAVEEAGLDPKTVTPHLLRHTAAVHLLAAHVPMQVVSKWLGHESIRTTERYYAKFAPGYLGTARDAYDARR